MIRSRLRATRRAPRPATPTATKARSSVAARAARGRRTGRSLVDCSVLGPVALRITSFTSASDSPAFVVRSPRSPSARAAGCELLAAPRKTLSSSGCIASGPAAAGSTATARTNRWRFTPAGRTPRSGGRRFAAPRARSCVRGATTGCVVPAGVSPGALASASATVVGATPSAGVDVGDEAGAGSGGDAGAGSEGGSAVADGAGAAGSG